MKKSIVEMILEFIRQVRRSKRWQRAVTCVAALVVFVTTYALILPAITMEGIHPRLASEKLAGWAGDAMSVNVSAESPAGSGEKVVVLTAESVSAGLSEEYEFDAEGVAVIEDKMGQEIRLHRTVRENTEDTVDYWFVLAAGQKTEFTLDLQDEIVVDDVIASAGIVENVRTNKTEEAEKASASDAVKVEETEVAAVVTEATASNAAKKSVAKATASNTAKASASNADVEDEEDVDTDEDTGEILDGAVINDLDVSDIDQETEVTATLKLNAGMGDDLAGAIRDAEMSAEKRGNASLEFRWKMIVNTTQELEWSENGVTVHMYYNAAAKIPEGAHLSVAEILEDDASYQAYLDSAKAAVNSEALKATASVAAGDYDVNHARFFDIKILDAEENEIEPEAQVVVKINYDESVAIEEDASVKTVHFPKEGGTEVIDSVVDGGSTNLDGVAFNANSFSVYGILGAALKTEITLPGSDSTYEVSVTYGRDAKIPQGARLEVAALTADSEKYKEAKEAVIAAKKAADKTFDEKDLGFAALDITIADAEGNPVEPAEGAEVKVAFKMKSLPGSASEEVLADTLEIQHLNEAAGTATVETVAEVQDVKVANGTAVAEFTVTSFSTFALTWDDGTSYIHWGVMENGTFTEWDKTNLDTSAGSVSLNALYDGYTILNATYYTASESISDANAGTDIEWNLDKNTDGTWKYTVRSSETTGTVADGSQIYVYYINNNDIPETEKPTVVPSTQPDPLKTSKTVVANKNADGEEDGTYKITLSVTGDIVEDSHTETSSANVIVVLDVSSSMKETLSDGTTRLAAMKSAANILVDAMPNAANVEMTVLSFSGSATTTRNWTTINSDSVKNTIKSAINGLSTGSGTDWPEALDLAKTVADNKKNSGDTDPTYIIFLTDGCPSRPEDRNHSHGSEGTQNINDTCISDSLSTMTTMVQTGYTVYGIYANATSQSTRPYSGNGWNAQYTGDTDPLQYVMRVSGAGVANYYQASEADAIADVFEALAKTITNNLGYSNVSVDDGITDLTSVEASVSVSGAAGNFEYSRSGGSYGTGTPWTDAPAASASGSGVTWDLSSVGNLEQGVTYTVSFDIWPSQEAYDLIADLNNGIVDYDKLDQDVKAQVGGHDTGHYYLLTNTYLNTNYTFNNTSYQYQGDKGDGAMPLVTENISVKKIWNNPVDSHIGDDTGNSVKLYLTKDGELYLYGDNAITVSGTGREWTSSKDIYISCGVIAEGKVKEPGHDYSIAEPDSFAYFWDLKADVYHPMVIDGKTTMLIQDDSATSDYYTLTGADGKDHKYVETGTPENILTAVNDRRSNLNLTKVINDQSDDQGADKDTLFEYSIIVNNPNVEKGKESDTHSDYYVWFSVYDPENEYRSGKDAHLVDDKTLETSDNVTAEADNTGYFYVPSGEIFTVKIKEGWNLRAINLPIETTYSIVETVESGWEFDGAEGSAWNYETNPGSSEAYAPTVSTGTATISGSIPKSNRSYTVTATNKWLPDKTITVNKTWAENNFVTAHGDINVALFKVVDGAETYIEGSVKSIKAPDETVTFSVSSLDENIVVREVTVSTETTGEGDDTVTTTKVTPIAANGVIAVENETTTFAVSGGATDTYIVTYSQGTASGTTRTDTITNTMPQLVVNKNDSGNNRLAGAVFKLTGEDGQTALNEYGTITSSDAKDGNLLNGIYLSNGMYYLVETEAPAGYNKLTYKVKLEVDANNVVISAVTDPSSTINIADETSDNKLLYTYTVHNSDGTELPHTGGRGTLPFRIAGLALMLMGAAYVSYDFETRRRRERRLKK